MLSNYLPTDYQNFIALSRYARWREDDQRRENWGETVDRYFSYMTEHLKTNYNYELTKALKEKLTTQIMNLGVMPSMRALMTSGPALDRCHVGGYNCSYIPVDSPRSFDECMYILMCGTGVGFSVERENVDKLPIVNEHFEDSTTVIHVADSRPGWAKALRELIAKGKPEMGTFMREWTSLYESKSGERGIFNRQAAKVKALENGRRDADYYFGCNPCSEIILRPYQFCNLTEVVCRVTDDLVSLKEKVRMATILGTLQSTLTNFKYLRKIWKDNTEEERLLGVSLTGILDCPILNHDYYELSDTLEELRAVAVETNKKIAKDLGIPQSTAITCIKPSGTVSQLVDSASGIHARHSDYYIRTVRGDNKDPLTKFMQDSGIPSEPCAMKPDSTTVFSFPMKSPSGATTRTKMTAIQQLEFWLLYQRYWCEHKPSVTISVKEDEWMQVGAWVYENFDEVSGISFLPFSDHTYAQAPYQDIVGEEYERAYKKMPTSIDWSKLADYEKEDTTTGGRELACTADACEMVDIEAS